MIKLADCIELFITKSSKRKKDRLNNHEQIMKLLLWGNYSEVNPNRSKYPKKQKEEGG